MSVCNYSNYPQCGTERQSNINNERENKRLGERLKKHNGIHWYFGRSERIGVAVILEEIMANSFPELIKALL